MQDNMMQQARILQERMQKIQDELDSTEITATVGGVTISITGKMDFKAVVIDPKKYFGGQHSEKEFAELEEHIEACYANVKTKVETHVQDKMQSATGDMKLPWA